MNNENLWRYTLIGALLSVLPILIIFKLVNIQTNPEQVQAFIEQGKSYEGVWKTIVPARGQIFDRHGRLLAGNQTVYQLGVELSQVENPETIALTLSVVLGLDVKDTLAIASQEASPTRVFAVLADWVTQEQIDRLAGFKDQIDASYGSSTEENAPSLAGLTWNPHLARSYPEKSVASNLLGFVNFEGKGFYGVEEQYDELLAGKSKSLWSSLAPNKVQELPNVPDGASLILTIDRTIQAEVESILDRSIEENGAESGTIVVLDPKTGEILALASTPRIDLNDYINQLDQFAKGVPYNRGVSQAYETGSVFKVLTMAAGLDSGAVKPDTSFLDTGVFELGGTLIYNWNGGAWGPQDMTGCMQHSLNVCLAWIAQQTGTGTFYDYMHKFGIGRLTGVDLGGEVTGRLKSPGDEDWYDADLATNSFGQGVASTPIQMAAAVSAIANDGKIMTPHIVRSIVNKGRQYDIEQRVSSVPIKAETARTLTEMLVNSLETEASSALVPGYRVAGKTGTAEIPTPYGYTSDRTNTSFVGWGPASDPRFVVYVWLEKPTTSIWGSEVASPIFSEVVQRLVVLMNLPPDDVMQQLRSQ